MNDAATGAEIVRFSHVSKHYSGTLANDDVSLTIRRGDFSIGDGAWKAFDIVANDVVIQFRLTAAAQ